MPPTGRDGAPRDDGSDFRWSSDYLYIVTAHPDAKPYLLPLLKQVYDQGARGGADPGWDVDSSRPEALWLIVQRAHKGVSRMKTILDGWGWGG